MGADVVVKVEPITDHPLGDEAIRHLVQVDRLVFEAAPEPLDEDVVHAAAPAIHGDFDTRSFQQIREGGRGELAALVRVEDGGFGVSGQGLAEGLDTEASIERIR